MRIRYKILLGYLLIGFGIYLLRVEVSHHEESYNFFNKTKEQYNSQYNYVNDLDLALKLIELEYSTKQNPEIKKQDSFQFLKLTKEFVKRTFYHGVASYKWQENWICYLLSKTIWSDFNSVVSPYEVIKHSKALCSQQTMVFTKLMSLKGFKYRYVYIIGLKNGFGHFCCEIWEGGKWHFYDVNGEPNWTAIEGTPNKSIEELRKHNELYKIYDSTIIDPEKLKSDIKISYSKINEDLGRNMINFQQLTKELSWIIPLILGSFLVMDGLYFQNKRAIPKKSNASV